MTRAPVSDRAPESDPRDDAALVAAVTDGDREAFAELYRRHLPWLLVRLGRRCSSPELVDEVVQDTFVAVWRSAGRWDRRGEVAAWIWGIGIRRLVDALRRSRPPTDRADGVRWRRDVGRGARAARRPVRRRGCGTGEPVTRATGRRAGDRPGWTDDPGGRPVAGHPAGHGQDTDDARPRCSCGSGWHDGEVGDDRDGIWIRRRSAGTRRELSAPDLAASAEAHLMNCAVCRAVISSLCGYPAGGGDLARGGRPGRRTPAGAGPNGCWSGSASARRRRGSWPRRRRCGGRGWLAVAGVLALRGCGGSGR